MLKKDKSSLLITAGAATLLIAGGVAAYFAILLRTSSTDLPVGANVIPQDAMMAISLTTDAGQWDKLRQFGTPESKAAFDRLLGQLRDNFLTVNGYGYQQDIQPWVGKEVTIAFLPNQTLTPATPPSPNSPASPPPQQSVIAVLPIANPLKAKEILGKPKPLNQGKMVERTYKGVQITETQGVPNQNLSVAVLGTEYLIVTSNGKATDRAIDTYKGDAAIAKTPGYISALQKIKSPAPFAQIYANIPAAAAYASINSARPVPQENLDQLQHQGFATTVTVEPEGVGFKAISWLKPNSQNRLAVENNAQKMVTLLPNPTLMMMSGGNFQRLWQDYVKGANSNPVAPINPQDVQAYIKSNTGMDWEKDFINWMGGEFSLSLIPAVTTTATTNNAQARFGAGFLVMVQASDRRAADKSLKQLDDIMKTKQFRVEETQANGQPVVKWSSRFGGLTVTRGWLNGNIAFLTLGAPILESFLPTPKSALVANELFQRSVRSELKPNNGNFFIDVDNTFNPKNLSMPELPANQKVWVDAIQSIGVTAAVINDRTTRYDAFVKLKTGLRSTPSPNPPAASPKLPAGSPSPSPTSPSPSPTINNSPN